MLENLLSAGSLVGNLALTGFCGYRTYLIYRDEIPPAHFLFSAISSPVQSRFWGRSYMSIIVAKPPLPIYVVLPSLFAWYRWNSYHSDGHNNVSLMLAADTLLCVAWLSCLFAHTLEKSRQYLKPWFLRLWCITNVITTLISCCLLLLLLVLPPTSVRPVGAPSDGTGAIFNTNSSLASPAAAAAAAVALVVLVAMLVLTFLLSERPSLVLCDPWYHLETLTKRYHVTVENYLTPEEVRAFTANASKVYEMEGSNRASPFFGELSYKEWIFELPSP